MAKTKKKWQQYDLETGDLLTGEEPKKQVKSRQEGSATLFDFINDITLNKKGILNEENKSAFDKFMVCRFLSMDQKLIELVHYICQHQDVSDELFYKFVMAAIPRSKRYLKYAKGTERFKEREDIIELLIEKYEISKREAYQYLILMSEEDIKMLKREFAKE